MLIPMYKEIGDKDNAAGYVQTCTEYIRLRDEKGNTCPWHTVAMIEVRTYYPHKSDIKRARKHYKRLFSISKGMTKCISHHIDASPVGGMFMKQKSVLTYIKTSQCKG